MDMPILGKEEVGVPVDQMVQEAMASTVFHLPEYLSTVYAQLQPYIEKEKKKAFQDVERFANQQMEKLVRPEIESQKAAVMADIDRTTNKVLFTAGLIGLTVVGGVTLSAWYYKR
jgi:hypothetical protein